MSGIRIELNKIEFNVRALAIESQVTVTARTRAHENPKCYSALYETAARSAAKICYRALCEMTARSAKICTILHEVVGCYSKFAFKASGEFHEKSHPPPKSPLLFPDLEQGVEHELFVFAKYNVVKPKHDCEPNEYSTF